MELPKINSLRSKSLKLNNKTFKLNTWSNSTLVEFESIVSDNLQNDILEYLIKPYVESNHTMNLLEERVVLLELYKLSKSNLLDIKYNCKSCETISSYVMYLDKAYVRKELENRTIKTDNFTFNLKSSSNYRVDTTKNKHKESIMYIASYIDSFMYKKKTHECIDLDDTAKWIEEELSSTDFNSLFNQFNEIQPSIEISVTGNCEHCNALQKLDFKGIEHFLKS